MPNAAQSHAETRSRPNCTALAGAFDAGEIAVCRASGLVALHFSTPSGRFIFRVLEKSFVRACRGPHDHNGQPFRTLAEITAREDRERGDPAETTPPQPIETVAVAAEEAVEHGLGTGFNAAWKYLLDHLHLPVRDVAGRFGLESAKLSWWIGSQHPGELRKLRTAAGLSLCPKPRKNLTTIAARGELLLKPGHAQL